jgi:hypothetical protein
MKRYKICQGCNREFLSADKRSRRDNKTLICVACAKIEEFQEYLTLTGNPPQLILPAVWQHFARYE